MFFTDITEVKAVLEIAAGDTSQDVLLSLYLEWASALLEELLNRDVSYKVRTWYYNGRGTQKLPLRHRPVFLTTPLQVYVDQGGMAGQAQGTPFDPANTLLTYGVDYYLDVDQDNGSSRSGLLIRVNDLWLKQAVRRGGLLTPYLIQGQGNIKVVSAAGYTVDTLPAPLRSACDLLVAKYRGLFPLGQILGSESYEERAISIMDQQRNYLMNLVYPLALNYRNWKW